MHQYVMINRMRIGLLIISLLMIFGNCLYAMIQTLGVVKQWQLIYCDRCPKSHTFIQGITEGKSEVIIWVSPTNSNKFVGANILLALNSRFSTCARICGTISGKIWAQAGITQ